MRYASSVSVRVINNARLSGMFTASLTAVCISRAARRGPTPSANPWLSVCASRTMASSVRPTGLLDDPLRRASNDRPYLT